jgi:hypothetical protein
VCHRAQDVEPGGGAAGDDGGSPQKLPTGDESSLELLGQLAETLVYHGGLPGRISLQSPVPVNSAME